MKHDLETIAGVKAALVDLERALQDKGALFSKLEFSLEAGREYIYARAKSDGVLPCGDDCKFFRGPASESFPAAFEYVASLPAPETAALRRHMKRVADAIDKGREEGVPSEYTDPLAVVVQDMSGKLLEGESK